MSTKAIGAGMNKTEEDDEYLDFWVKHQGECESLQRCARAPLAVLTAFEIIVQIVVPLWI